MSLLLWLLAGALAGAVVYECYVSYINKQSALNAAKNSMSTDELRKTLKAKIKSKDATHVTLDMLDSASNSVCEVRITGDSVSDDIRCGDILYV